MHTLFVINPFSGGRDKTDIEKQITTFVGNSRTEIAFYYTTGKNDAKNIKNIIDSDSPERIIAVGGDGTVNLVARLVLNTTMVMGIIPMGSANGLARELNLPTGITDALEVLQLNKIKKIDAIRLNNQHLSVHLCDIGFNARVIERFEKDNIRGMLGYAKHYLNEIGQYHSFKVSVQPQGKKRRKYKASMLVLANATKYGTGVQINPKGKIDDGKLEIILIRPYTFKHLIHLAWSLITGTLHKLQYVKIFKGKKFTIINHEKQPFQIDGELVEPERKITVEIIPQKLQILIP
ncbi:MAG: diacylglycerol/lipid kinase family protein [Bacteroidota bacterium]